MPRYSIPINTNVSLAANTAKTIMAVSTPSTRRARLCGFEFGFDSTTGTDNSVLWEIVRSDATTAGTATSTTPVPVDQGETAALCSGFTNYTAEPTTLTVLKSDRCTPVGGGIIFPLEVEDQFIASATNRIIGIRLTAAQPQNNVRGTLWFEE